MRRLLLVRHGATDAVRRVAFPCDEHLDDRGRAEAEALREWLADADDAFTSSAMRAVETAAALDLPAVVEPALDECDFGSWRGRTLRELYEEDPEAVAQWMNQPDRAPHGGESLAELVERVGAWLEQQTQRDGTAAAVTHGEVIKSAVVHALRAPLDAFWRVDVAPLAITELHAHGGRWTVARLNWRPTARAARVAAAGVAHRGARA
jgi:broad specificity phosphatase PhoE